MKPISDAPLDKQVICNLPHHCVINPNGVSLNDILHIGPILQAYLVLLILRWRIFQFFYNCDITQMYRQNCVHPKHSCLQRIVFHNLPSDPILDYKLQTVTFGINCAISW